MRFLHLSDLHIGRRLSGFSLLDDQRHMLKQALEMADSCDAVLLAGDLYDKAQPPAEAVRLMSDFLVRLSRMKKPVFSVSGNHDSPEQVAYCCELLGECGVYASPVFDGKLTCHVLQDEWGEVCVWLMPFVRPSSIRPFAPDVKTYEDAVRFALSTAKLDDSRRHVLVAHQYVSGAEPCDSELRLIGGVDQVSLNAFDGFDYVALGHLHSPQRLDGGRVCYAGSPLAYSISEEKQRKAALAVTLQQKGSLVVDARPFQPLHPLRTVEGTLAQISDPALYSEDYVYAVLTDEGALMDPLGALRLTYPRLAGMRILNSRTNDEAAAIENVSAEELSPLEHFCAFYQAQNHQQPLDKRRARVMQRILEEAEAKRYAPTQA